jgi:serine/threonine-protein kinase
MPTKSENQPLMSGHSSDSASRSEPTEDNPINQPATARNLRPDIPNYDISDEIAQSETSFVYIANDRRLGKEVAIKISRTFHQGGETISQFVDSARIEAKLQHPGVPPVFELGFLPDGRPYQVMKLIKGETLSTLLNERINPVTDRIRFLSVFEKLSQTIAYVHSQSVIHCDLRSQHVMIDNFGDVQVIGWRFAMLLAGEKAGISPKPHCGVSLGASPTYISPELARGDWETVDRRSDVFSLGAILLEILTGRPPFIGHVPSEALNKAAIGDLSEALTRLDHCGEESELIAIAKSCLNPNPTLRPGDAGELATRISSYRTGVEQCVRTNEAARLAAELIETEKGKRRQLTAALVLVVGIFLIWAGAMIWWKDRQATVKNMFEGAREPDEKQAHQSAERERSAQERRTRELQERAILIQKQTRQKLERELSARKKKNLQELELAPPPREVKQSDP